MTRLVPKIDVYKSSYPVYCRAGNIDMLSTEAFFTLKKERSIYMQHTVDNEVSALARLAFYENSLIGQELSVRCPH